MELRKLAKDASSGKSGCPTVYVAGDGTFVVQGEAVDPATYANLENVLPGETAVRIKPEVVIEALRQFGSAE